MFDETIGSRMKELRKAYALNQLQMANILGIGQSHLSAIERDAKKPSKAVIRLFANMFYITEEWLVTGQGSQFNEKIRKPVTAKIIESRWNTSTGYIVKYVKLAQYLFPSCDLDKAIFSLVNNVDLQMLINYFVSSSLEGSTNFLELVHHIEDVLPNYREYCLMFNEKKTFVENSIPENWAKIISMIPFVEGKSEFWRTGEYVALEDEILNNRLMPSRVQKVLENS